MSAPSRHGADADHQAGDSERLATPAPRESPAPGAPDASALLRETFRRHPAGVAVITAYGHGRPVGFTATSLASVALQPPLLSFNVGSGSSSWPVLAEAAHVGVHLVPEERSAVAATFATSGADRFAPPTRWWLGPHRVPVLEGMGGWLVCRVVARVPAGDHRLVLAEVCAGEAAGEARPLLYHGGRFTGLRD